MIMNKKYFPLFLTFLLFCFTGDGISQATNSSTIKVKNEIITLSSVQFSEGGVIPSECACEWLGGQNRPPLLEWHNAPPETGSFTLIMQDETRNKGDKAATHWSLFNIPASITETEQLSEQAVSGVSEGRNYRKKLGYAGTCPPGMHIYTFTIFALNTEMPMIPPGKEVTKSKFEREYKDYIIDSATLSGSYKPSKSRLLLNRAKTLISKLLR